MIYFLIFPYCLFLRVGQAIIKLYTRPIVTIFRHSPKKRDPYVSLKSVERCWLKRFHNWFLIATRKLVGGTIIQENIYFCPDT